MNEERFNEIIDFAIKSEQEAVDFYHDLQSMSSFEIQKELLKEYEMMEKGHINMLQNIKSKGISDATHIPKVENLSISDYLVDVEPQPNMEYQDLIIIAMKREERSLKLYQTLADKSETDEVKNIFSRLAAEEAIHKNHFEKIYDDEILKHN
ncbi:ferritin family protein [Calditrichota bacterium]